MTIAACYVSPEGIVLGADSTASFDFGALHFYNHNQKLFELGDKDTTFGIVTWGLGGLRDISYRTLFAKLSADIKTTPARDPLDVATRWATLYWQAYSSAAHLIGQRQRAQQLQAKPAYDPKATPVAPTARTQAEEEEYENLRRDLGAGFCIGGYTEPDRVPQAFEITFWPEDQAAPTPSPIPMHNHRFWGAPNMTHRLIYGCDSDFIHRLRNSGKWNGTPTDLQNVIEPGRLIQPVMPIRDAVDFVHTCIYSTIKALKFSSFSQICGGPIELAVITTDRKFRWVRHKEWDAAVWENG
ncbi:MAG: hypothetical protein AAB403_03050 [Planctomycetota bacterium]|mgnify:CR=1 FL=1